MKSSIYQAKIKMQDYYRARKMYQTGMSLRDVGKQLNRSYQWVWFVVKGKGIKELERLNLKDLTRNYRNK